MALTLVEAAKLESGNVIKSSIIEMYARESDILMTLPFDDIPGNALSYNQEQTLPGVAFRGVNESYTESTGIINPLTESLTICGGDLDVDLFILKTMGQGQRAVQEQMKIKALAAEFTRVFVKGDSEANPREFDGIQKRVAGAQKITNSASSGGAALSLLKLDEAIDATDGATHLFMNKTMRRLLTAAARTTSVSGNITYDVDAFGRQITKYNNLPILVPYSANGGTEPIAFDEANSGGGSAVGTSIYVLAFGDGKLQGIQNGTMDVRDLGELQTAPKVRTRVEWYPGIVIYHGRAVTRLYSITNAAVVA